MVSSPRFLPKSDIQKIFMSYVVLNLTLGFVIGLILAYVINIIISRSGAPLTSTPSTLSGTSNSPAPRRDFAPSQVFALPPPLCYTAGGMGLMLMAHGEV